MLLLVLLLISGRCSSSSSSCAVCVWAAEGAEVCRRQQLVEGPTHCCIWPKLLPIWPDVIHNSIIHCTCQQRVRCRGQQAHLWWQRCGGCWVQLWALLSKVLGGIELRQHHVAWQRPRQRWRRCDLHLCDGGRAPSCCQPVGW